MFLQILYTIGLAILGMLTMAWYNGFTTPSTGPFTFKYFWECNYEAFLYSVIGVCLILSVIGIVPEVSNILETVFGIVIKVPVSGGGSYSMGIIIYEMVRKKLKVKTI